MDQCKRHYVKVTPPENIQIFLHQLTKIKDNKKKAINLLLEEICKDVTGQESFIQKQNTQLKEAEASLRNLKDCLQVLRVAKDMIPQLQGQFHGQGVSEENRGMMVDAEENRGLIDAEKSINIQHVAGVIEQSEIERLRRLIFRSTKGKSYMHVQAYNHDDRDDMTKIDKSVYIIVFWDGQHIRDKIQRVCDSFQGQRYDLPEISEINTQINKLSESISNARSVFERTRYELREQLIGFDSIDGQNDFDGDARRSSRIYIFKMFIAKEKALYQTLNMMKWQNTSFVGYFWAPHEQEEKIKSQLASQTATKIMAYKNHQIDPPTYFKTTEVS